MSDHFTRVKEMKEDESRELDSNTAPEQMIETDKNDDRLDWNVDSEVQLFYSMKGHKPVGVNKHFQMACIHEKFRNSIQKDVSSQQIWDHLETMYDMGALHESEILPFPNEECEFRLPDSEFGKLAKRDLGSEEKIKEDNSLKSKSDSSSDDKESGGKDVKLKEAKDGDTMENSPKRKRNTRQSQEPSSKPASPAASTQGGKRRRV